MTALQLYGQAVADLNAQQDGYRAAAGSRLGHLYTLNGWEHLNLSGAVHVANAGTITTPLTFGAGSIDTTEPDLDLSVPDGYTVFPLSITVKIEAFGTDAIFELMASTGVGGTQGTDTNITPVSLRTPALRTSQCSIGAASNADAVYMTSNVAEFWRDGITKVATTGTGDDDSNRGGETFRWTRPADGTGPVLIGGASVARLNVFAAGQATTGFITLVYAEVPTATMYG